MARFTYSADHISFIAAEFKQHSIADVTKQFNKKFGLSKTESQIRAAIKNRKLKCGRKQGELTSGKYRSFTYEQAMFVKHGYKQMSLAVLTNAFNREYPDNPKTAKQIRSLTRNHGFKSGRTGRFEKGAESWNKGTKGVMKPNSGNFKKGHDPHNIRELGAERISKDGYIEIKVAEENPHTGHSTRFKLKHRHIWEQTNGPVPSGTCIWFKDGDRQNCNLDNLELIDRGENAIRNKLGYRDTPDELKPSFSGMAKLMVAAKRAAQRPNDSKQ